MPPSKKMIPSMILDILKRKTDENHTLDQKDILDELNQEFDPPLDRKTVRRNIEYLLDIGCPIVYKEKPRSNGNDIWTDFYLARDFTEAELRRRVKAPDRRTAVFEPCALQALPESHREARRPCK